MSLIAAISLFAIKRLKLDACGWLVTPGNPLKDQDGLRDLKRAPRGRAQHGQRSADRRQLSRNPSLNQIYHRTPSSYCAAALPACASSGSWALKISRSFMRWQNWRRIASEVPIAVIDRPPQSFRAGSPHRPLRRSRAIACPENQAGRLADQRAPAWIFLTGMKLNLSSNGTSDPDGQLGGHRSDTMGLSEKWVHWNIETVNPHA